MVFLRYFVITFLMMMSVIYMAISKIELTILENKANWVNYLLSEKDNKITAEHNYNERLTNEIVIRKLKKVPDEIIIGSSLTMQFTKNKNDYSFINHGMSGSSLEDMLILIHAYEKYHSNIPKKIFFVVDPWLLNNNAGKIQSTKFSSELRNSFLKNKNLGLTQEFIDLDLSLEKLYKLFLTMTHLQSYEVPNQNIKLDVDKFIKKSDMSIIYSDDVYNISQVDYEKIISTEIDRGLFGASNFENYRETNELEELFNLIKKYNSDLKLIFMPMNPLILSAIENKPKYNLYINSEKTIKTIAGKYQIKFCGSYGPNFYNIKKDDFFDAYHHKRVVSNEIINSCID